MSEARRSPRRLAPPGGQTALDFGGGVDPAPSPRGVWPPDPATVGEAVVFDLRDRSLAECAALGAEAAACDAAGQLVLVDLGARPDAEAAAAYRAFHAARIAPRVHGP